MLLTLGAYARVTVVICSVCLSVTTLAATYLSFKSQMKCHKVLYGTFNRCIVWISLKTLCSKVFGVVCLRAGLPSSIYVPDELSMDSANISGLFQD